MNKTLFIWLTSLLLLTACTENEVCRENTDVYLRAAFMQRGTTNALTLQSLSVRGMNRDSLLYNNQSNVRAMILPLNRFNQVSIFICTMNGITDTLSIYHTNNDFLISYACGVVIAHQIDTILTTNHFIEKVNIIEPHVNTATTQHLQIFH